MCSSDLSRPSRTRRRRVAVTVLTVASAALMLGACGGGDESTFTGEAARGEGVARDLGCAQCHSSSPGVAIHGPSWAGLAGSQVTLEDGSKVTADRAYLERAIKEPSAEVVEGFKPLMPTVPLDDTQIDQVIAYIEALGNN